MFGLRLELDGLREEAISVLLEAPPSVTNLSSFRSWLLLLLLLLLLL